MEICLPTYNGVNYTIGRFLRVKWKSMQLTQLVFVQQSTGYLRISVSMSGLWHWRAHRRWEDVRCVHWPTNLIWACQFDNHIEETPNFQLSSNYLPIPLTIDMVNWQQAPNANTHIHVYHTLHSSHLWKGTRIYNNITLYPHLRQDKIYAFYFEKANISQILIFAYSHRNRAYIFCCRLSQDFGFANWHHQVALKRRSPAASALFSSRIKGD